MEDEDRAPRESKGDEGRFKPEKFMPGVEEKKTFFKGLKGEGVKQLFLIIHRFCSWSFTYSLKFVTPQSVLVMLLWSFGT